MYRKTIILRRIRWMKYVARVYRRLRFVVYSVAMWVLIDIGCEDKIPKDKIPADKIPTDKIPTTGFRCGCPDFLDLYIHAWFGLMVHVYIHTITMQSCLMHPTLLCCFWYILLLTETLILTIWCNKSGICINGFHLCSAMQLILLSGWDFVRWGFVRWDFVRWDFVLHSDIV